MSIIVDYEIPASQFLLGETLQRVPGIEIELDRMVPVGTTAIPYFWLTNDERERFERVLDRESDLSGEVVDELDGRTLYRTSWDAVDKPFLEALLSCDAVLLRGNGDADSWEVRLRFPDSESLSAFHSTCRDAGVDVRVERLYHDGGAPSTGSLMTESQRELVERAYDEGYFDIPRQVTLEGLAEQLDISDQAVSERLRRGLEALVETTVKSPASVRERSEQDEDAT